MATVNKDFKIKSGLIVEGTTATVNGYDVLTKKQADQDYVVNLIGGTATSDNTPSTVVKRDASGNFAAQDITVNTLYVGGSTNNGIDVVDGDTEIGSNNGILLSASDDIALNSGNGDIVLNPDGSAYIGSKSATNVIATIHDTVQAASSAQSAAETYADGVASAAQTAAEGYTDSAISTEVTNRNSAIATAKGEAISDANGYTDGKISTEVSDRNSAISSAITALDLAGTYDPLGAASDVQDNLDYHTGLTSGVHGTTGSVVGTTDSQTLTNKTVGDTLYFTDGVTVANEGEILINPSSNDFEVTANTANLHLKAHGDVTVTAENGDIVLSADGNSYVGSVSAGNEIATNSYVDNAVSGLAWKKAVNVKADSNVTVASSVVGLSIDGHEALTTADAGYRILLTGQSTDSENGIWEAFEGDGTLYIRRSADADVYSELIGAAVYVMEGTQYAGTSWVQNDHYLTTFAGQTWTQFSGNGTVTAGTGITVDGLEVSIDRTTVDTWYDEAGAAGAAEASANSYTDGEITSALTTAQGYATTAQGNAEDYADGLISTEVTNRNSAIATAKSEANSYTDGEISTLDTAAQGYADAAETAANGYADFIVAKEVTDRNSAITSAVNALDTDAIEEGSTNQYFLDSRAKSSAADLLTGASLTNITITGTGAGLTITAENGVADSDTDDLDEGTTNLYFTDARAYDAVNGTNIGFESVDITWVRKEEATWTPVNTASTATVHSFATNKGSVKYLVRVISNRKSHVTEVLATTDSDNNVAVVEYGTIYTSENPLAAATVVWNSGTSQYDLNVTTTQNNSEVLVAATLLAYND